MDIHGNRMWPKQQGTSLTTVMVIISIAMFLGLFTFKLVPHYLENLTVSTIAEELSENTELLKQPRSKIYAHLTRAYRTNNLWDLDAEETILLKKSRNKGYIVTVQYEKRTNLFHNIDLVTSFNNAVNADETEAEE